MTDLNKQFIKDSLDERSQESTEEIVTELSSKLIESYYYMKIAKKNFEREGLDKSVNYTQKRMDEIERLLKSSFGTHFEV